MKEITKKELLKIHTDYKATINGVVHILELDKTGATCLVPVKIIGAKEKIFLIPAESML